MRGFKLKIQYTNEEKIVYFRKLIEAAHAAIEQWMRVIEKLEAEIKAEKPKEGKES